MSHIFISYRREDSADVTGRIHDHLSRTFGSSNIFTDVDSIPPGRDFREYIDEKVRQCKVLLAVIGPRWVDIKDSEGNVRLQDPQDFVRLEIESALNRDILVIPVLVKGAAMPNEAALPSSLQQLAYRNAVPIRRNPDFTNDINRLVRGLAEQLDLSDVPAAEPEVVQDKGKLLTYFVGLALILTILGLILFIPCPTEAQFLVFRIVLSVAVGGFVVLLPGYFKLKYNRVVTAGGSLAVAAAVYIFNPALISTSGRCQDTFDINLFFYSGEDKSTIIKQGTVSITQNGIRSTHEIDDQGRVRLEGLIGDWRGDQIIINPQIPDYDHTQLIDTIPTEGRSMDIALAPKQHLTTVRGNITDGNNQPIAGAWMDIDGHKGQTNQQGDYKFEIPVKSGTYAQYRVFVQDTVAYNGKEIVSEVFHSLKLEP